MMKIHKKIGSKKNWWNKSILRTMMGKITIHDPFNILLMNQESWMWLVIRRNMKVFSD